MTYSDAVQFSVIYAYPVWLVGCLAVGVLLLAQEAGYRVGLQRRRQEGPGDAESGGGGMVLSSMLAIVGLLMAFTFAAAVERHEARRHAIIEEANALGTAYLRADVIVEPVRTELKLALFEYAKTRAPSAKVITDEARRQAVARSLEAQKPIWPLTRRAVDADDRGAIVAGLLSAVTELLDMNTVRLAAIVNKLPAPALYMLSFIAAVSLSVAGFNAGRDGRISRWRMALFAFVLGGMMMLIVDFDSPNEGMIRVDRLMLLVVIDDMTADLAQ